LAKFPQEISCYALIRVLYDVAQRQPPSRASHCPTSAAMLDYMWIYKVMELPGKGFFGNGMMWLFSIVILSKHFRGKYDD